MDSRRWPSIATIKQKELFEKWKNNLSDLLLIQKEGTDLHKAASFFRKELDEDIPFEKMGFLNLFEFFFHCHEVIQLRAMNNKYFLFYREDACPADQRHLRQLARGQASSKTKIGVGFGLKIRPNFNNTHPISIHSLLQMNYNQMVLNRVVKSDTPSPSRYHNQRKSFQSPRFQNRQGSYQQPQRTQSFNEPRHYGYSNSNNRPQTFVPQAFAPQTFAPGPPTPVKSSFKPSSSNKNYLMNHLNYDAYDTPSPSDSSDEFDLDFETTSNSKGPNYDENMMSRPSYKTGNPNANGVPPPPMSKSRSSMNIDTVDSRKICRSPIFNIAINSVKKQELTSNRPVSPVLPSNTWPVIPQRPKEVINLNNLDIHKEILIEKVKNMSTSCQNKTSSDASLVEDPKGNEDPKVNDSENIERKQQLMNKERLQCRSGRTFAIKLPFGGLQIRTVCQPLPDFINHEIAFVYIPVKRALECVYVDDILVDA